LVLVVSVLSIVALIFSMQYGGRLGTSEFSAPDGTESGRVEDLLDEEVAKTPPSFMLIFGNEDNRSSVALGIERTGRLITGAALIMATVFFSFGLAEAIVIKAIGLGMGLAVLVDATIVRALLVPATMRLMGHWNWWAPKPLARLHRRLGLSESAIDAADPPSSPYQEAASPARRR
jgi:hypothetical protein